MHVNADNSFYVIPNLLPKQKKQNKTLEIKLTTIGLADLTYQFQQQNKRLVQIKIGYLTWSRHL